MQDHALEVGEALVMDGGIRLTVLAVQEDHVVLGVTAPGLVAIEGPPEVRRKRRPRAESHADAVGERELLTGGKG